MPRTATARKTPAAALARPPMTAAEKMRRYRQERVTFKPADLAALEREAEKRGVLPETLVASIVDAWLKQSA